MSPNFEELYQKVSSVKQSLKDNRELYKKYIPFAENFAYSDFDWTEVVIVDKWKDDKGKERLAFTDGKTIEFAISKNRFEILRQSELGQILKFKFHKKEIKKEVENTYSWMRKKIIEYKYIPLIAEKSEKKHWEILEDTFVDYINKEKGIIHAITTENKEVFFPQIKPELQIGDFVTAKCYIKKVKNENRTELRQIQKIDKGSVLSKFQTQKDITGLLEVKYKNSRYDNFDFDEEIFDSDFDENGKLALCNKTIPDFEFIGDFYVPKYLLEKHLITNDCRVNARVIYAEDKIKRPRWKVIDVQKI